MEDLDKDKAKADQETAAAHAAKLASELEQVRAELAKGRADAVHAAELADSGRAMTRAELDRLTDQVGELRAHLYKRADSAPAVRSPSPAGIFPQAKRRGSFFSSMLWFLIEAKINLEQGVICASLDFYLAL